MLIFKTVYFRLTGSIPVNPKCYLITALIQEGKSQDISVTRMNLQMSEPKFKGMHLAVEG